MGHPWSAGAVTIGDELTVLAPNLRSMARWLLVVCRAPRDRVLAALAADQLAAATGGIGADMPHTFALVVYATDHHLDGGPRRDRENGPTNCQACSGTGDRLGGLGPTGARGCSECGGRGYFGELGTELSAYTPTSTRITI